MGWIHCDLMGNLIDIPIGIIGKEVQVDRLTIIKSQHIFIAQDLCGLIHRVVIQMDQNTVPLGVTE